MEQDRKTNNNAADKWWKEAPEERAVLCLISESLNDKENGGSITIGGNQMLLIDSIVDAMLKSQSFVRILNNAIMTYNQEKVRMN